MFFLNGSSKFITGFAVGFGTGLVARDAWPHIKRAFRPALKETLKLGIRLAELSRETLARTGENASDLIAEVRFEMRQEKGKTKKAKKSVPAPVEKAAS